ncbi:MAG: hypothetical protein F6K24_57445, partial [Okeania sp. SIO2D1]|nr:hypothetical protein [Okeania sp. SIO2D1]
MINLPGYEIYQKLYEGLKTTIYRGKSLAQKRPVIIKVLKAEYPSLEEITNFKQEYLITQSLACEGVIKSYALESYGHSLALI